MKIFYTFRPFGSYEQHSLIREEPWCSSGIVGIRQYKITVEEVKEPKEVLEERIRKLLADCTNYYQKRALKAEAKKLGINLDEK